MKHAILQWLPALLLLLAATAAYGQRITNANYQTVAYIKSDGTIQDGSYRTVGYIKSNGTIQDASYRTIGYARDIPLRWAAFFFFFSAN